jgi:hypothetical protein
LENGVISGIQLEDAIQRPVIDSQKKWTFCLSCLSPSAYDCGIVLFRRGVEDLISLHFGDFFIQAAEQERLSVAGISGEDNVLLGLDLLAQSRLGGRRNQNGLELFESQPVSIAAMAIVEAGQKINADWH